MFGGRYFGVGYFGATFWGDGDDSAVAAENGTNITIDDPAIRIDNASVRIDWAYIPINRLVTVVTGGRGFLTKVFGGRSAPLTKVVGAGEG